MTIFTFRRLYNHTKINSTLPYTVCVAHVSEDDLRWGSWEFQGDYLKETYSSQKELYIAHILYGLNVLELGLRCSPEI